MPELGAAGSGPLVLGPVLRRVHADTATVWVETASPAIVEVRATGGTGGGPGGSARTFSVHGHHYALVVVTGLPAAAVTPYQVLVDGVCCWPPPGDRFPAPMIRTRRPGAPVRLLFGSCRESTPQGTDRYPPDALDAYATRLAATRVAATADGNAAPDGDYPEHWPDTLVLLGDQVYADQPPGAIRGWLSARRVTHLPQAPSDQVADFHEYTRLYLDSWRDPELRWLLSTVPSVMIFDDHEIIDDWNSSEAWRAEATATPWWGDRIRAGLSSYWVYQHLGNLAPDGLAADPWYRAVADGGDVTDAMDALGARADSDRTWYRWSYALDLDRTRLVVLDNRCARRLDPGKRAMLPDSELDWLAGQLAGDVDHLAIGASLPWLMPPGIHHLEAIDELLSQSTRPRVARSAEQLRRWLDLEHWPAFGRSFETLGAMLGATGASATAPASISVLSGDVHHSYAARADLGPGVRSAVHQLTCSPIHNAVPAVMRPAMRLGWHRGVAGLAAALARSVGVPPPEVRWRKLVGPVFGNAIGTLICTGRSATATIETTTADRTLVTVADLSLTG